MTFIARKLTNTIAFFITDSRSTGEMCGQNSAGEKSLFFANIFAKNNQRHLLGKKQLFFAWAEIVMTRSRQSNEMWDDFFSEKFATCIMQLIAKNGGNHMCKYAQIAVLVLLNCNQIAWLLAIFRRLAKGPKASLWLPQWFYRYLLRQIDKTEECF